jgi:hypothetical protein
MLHVDLNGFIYLLTQRNRIGLKGVQDRLRCLPCPLMGYTLGLVIKGLLSISLRVLQLQMPRPHGVALRSDATHQLPA